MYWTMNYMLTQRCKYNVIRERNNNQNRIFSQLLSWLQYLLVLLGIASIMYSFFKFPNILVFTFISIVEQIQQIFINIKQFPYAIICYSKLFYYFIILS